MNNPEARKILKQCQIDLEQWFKEMDRKMKQ